MVVAVEPVCKRPGPVGLAAVRTDVGPLLEESAVEAFDLAVGSGSVGLAVLVDDLGLGQGLVEQDAAVAEVVVGDDALDDDAPGPEPGVGPAPERGGGAARLVGE